MWKKASVLPLLVCQLLSICKTGKEIFTYQSDFNLLADHIYAKIVIIAAIYTNLFRCQYDAIVKRAGRSLVQLFYSEIVSFGQLLPLNCEDSACSINKVG